MTLDPNAQSPDEYPTDAGAEARAEAERAAPEQPAAPSPEQPQPGMGDARRMMPNDYPQAPQPQGAYSQQPRHQPYPQYPQQPQYGQQPYGPPRPQGPYAPMYGPPNAERRRGGNGWKWAGGCLAGCLGLLILLALFCALAIGGTAFAFFHTVPVSASGSQSFHVAGVPTVRIHSNTGNVQVATGEAGTVTVAYEKQARGWDRGDAENALRNITVTTTQAGDVLDVQVNGPDWSGPHFWGDRSVRLDLTVPTQASIDTTLNAGNVDVRGVTGTVTVQNDAGNVTLDGVTLTGTSSVRDDAGNIEVRGALQGGASLEARTNAGNVRLTLPKATAAHLTATTHAGNIDVDPAWAVAVSRSYAGGTATGDLQPDPRGTLTLETDAGNITLDAAA